MSDSSITIVPRIAVYPGNLAKAKEILNWLVSLDVVKETVSDCVLGTEHGYAISTGATHITEDPQTLPFDFAINGLEIATERQIFFSTESEHAMDTCICPNCKENIVSDGFDFLDDWINGTDNTLTCSSCNMSNDVHTFQITPDWGFSDLGFTFCNWPAFTENFLNEFKRKLGCDINVVYQHL